MLKNNKRNNLIAKIIIKELIKNKFKKIKKHAYEI
jgi:hypothetical protein